MAEELNGVASPYWKILAQISRDQGQLQTEVQDLKKIQDQFQALQIQLARERGEHAGEVLDEQEHQALSQLVVAIQQRGGNLALFTPQEMDRIRARLVRVSDDFQTAGHLTAEDCQHFREMYDEWRGFYDKHGDTLKQMAVARDSGTIATRNWRTAVKANMVNTLLTLTIVLPASAALTILSHIIFHVP